MFELKSFDTLQEIKKLHMKLYHLRGHFALAYILYLSA